MIRRIVTREDGNALLASTVTPECWTALIPAAGRGSRLGVDIPKILFEVAGRSILVHLINLLSPYCERFVFVLSPHGAPFVEKTLLEVLPGRYEIAIQPEPRGMADAIERGLPAVKTSNLLVIWGDQVALHPESIDFCVRLLDGSLQPAAVCPTLFRRNPYIHFERDSSERMIRVLQAREGDLMPAEGESDSGLFLFRTEVLRQYMSRLLSAKDAIGAKTSETNFLPVLPLLDETPGQLVSARIMTEEESVGINSRTDAEYLEKTYFAKQHL